MGETQFLVGGTSLSSIVREADGLNQSFVGVIECPQGAFPELAGRRLFLVKYGNIDLRDLQVAAEGMRTIFVHDTAIRTQTNTTAEIGTGITLSLPLPAVGEETHTRTTIIPATRMITILNLPLPAVGEDIRTRTFMTVEPGTGTIRSLFDILTPRETRSQGVVVLDTGTGRLPRFPNTATTHTHATVIDGTGPGTLLSYL
ncbi:MAG: hypothetical protein ASARMPRED_004756 [Alectoria sarmentosa]|nr:MAG: hypothetical protein ASARMPRED_004756 [Alectoria sarmentosa]